MPIYIAHMIILLCRSIFQFLAIATGSCFLFMSLYSSSRKNVYVSSHCHEGSSQGRYTAWLGMVPYLLEVDRALIPNVGRASLDMNSTRPPFRPLPNPFKLFKQKDVIIILVSNGNCVAAYYAITAALSSLFAVNYPFLNETEIGLCFLAPDAGGVAGTVTAGKLLDVR